MRLSTPIVIVGIALATAIVLIVGFVLIDPDRPLLVNAEFSLQTITPNADGRDDVTEFNYEISENASIQLKFEDAAGEVYYFRDDVVRAPGSRRVQFSGVVDGFTYPDEQIAGEVMRRLMPDGEYTWTFTVTDQDSGEVATETGTLTLVDGDTALPDMTEFTVSPTEFTPNQDGIDDRVQVNVYLEKEAELTVYLEDEDGDRSFVPPREGCREENEAGRWCFDYDGGVTGGADPPDNGDYLIIAEAQDEVGQRIRRTAELTIIDGGVPFAEIVSPENGATVIFTPQTYADRYYTDVDTDGETVPYPDEPEVLNELPVTMQLGDMLVFGLTVRNYGSSPIRTTAGPWPGTVYQEEQNRGSMGAFEESGAWRVAIQCETLSESYPWRWALGMPDQLETEEDERNGNIYYYLPPDAEVQVWGAVRLTEKHQRNPQACWAGLIHEDVGVPNTNVGRREIELIEVAQSAGSDDN